MRLIGQFSNKVFSRITNFFILDHKLNKAKEIIDIIKQKTIPESSRMEFEVKIEYFNYDGLFLIQEAARITQNIVIKFIKLNIECKIAPPIYFISMSILEKSIGVGVLKHVIQEYKSALCSHQVDGEKDLIQVILLKIT